MNDPVAHKDRNRVVHPTGPYGGMTQICKGGRCWQMPGTGDAVEEALRAHIKATLGN